MVGTTVDGKTVESATTPVGVATAGRWTDDEIIEEVGSITSPVVGVDTGPSKNKYDMYFIVTLFLIVKNSTYLRLRVSPWTQTTHLASQIIGAP
jgi:hypothetical protein